MNKILSGTKKVVYDRIFVFYENQLFSILKLFVSYFSNTRLYYNPDLVTY